ncbi:MAG: PBP1A family penicillin-binding protein, partial [Nitrospinota bacterium]
YGHGAYGVEAAANTYFGKHVWELTLPEAAMLAGLPRAPARYSPYLAPKRALQRRRHVLRRMVENGFISPAQAEEAAKAPLHLRKREVKTVEAPYFVEQVRQYIEERYSSTDLYRGGLKVYTTLNREWQRAAEEAVREGVMAVDKRRGYRGPLAHVSLDRIDWQQIRALPWPKGLPLPRQEGQIVKGVVTRVGRKSVTVRLPDGSEGIIPLSKMKWAAKPNPLVDGMYRRIRRPSEALSVGDVIAARVLALPSKPGKRLTLALEQEPVVQGALLCMEVKTGAVKAMVGGYDFEKSQFNRATQAVRQPGSAFKPLIYATALTQGWTPASVILDAPIVIPDRPGHLWKPMNYDGKFHGPTTLRAGLTHSRNIVAIKLLREVGPEKVIQFAQKLGIESPLYPSLSLALGASGVTLLELVTAYDVFANQGVRMQPFFVRRIEDRYGNILEETRPAGEPVLSPQVAYLMTSMLESVVQEGTGRRVKALKRPVAGKTGTTNDFVDAWFVGFTPSYITGVWVGIDNMDPLGRRETGSRAASPIWLAFMQKALQGMPVEDFVQPEGLVTVQIDPETGLRAPPDEEDAITEIFLPGTEPTQYAVSMQRNIKDVFRQELQ